MASESGSDAGPARVRLVVGDARDPVVEDLVLRDHLRTGLGHVVQLVTADDASDLAEVDLVVVSESVDSHDVGAAYREAHVPVLVLENALFDAMGFGAGSSTRPASTAFAVTREEDALAGGLPSGEVTVFQGPSDLKIVDGLAEGGVVVARPTDGAGAVLFRFDEGARLTQGRAVARRVGLGFPASTYPRMTSAAYDVLDASVTWLLSRPEPARDGGALLLIGGDQMLVSEHAIRSRLRSIGFDVTVSHDHELGAHDPDTYELVVMSKTVHSLTVAAGLRDTHTPVLFWEDNQQALPMLATIDDDAQVATDWHVPGRRIRLVDGAPDALTGGRTGTIEFYVERAEITYAPSGSLGVGATRIGLFGDESGEDRTALYVFEAGATLADGQPARGRRGYFGLYDPSYRLLTADGVALFDAMVAWLVGGDEVSGPAAEDAQ